MGGQLPSRALPISNSTLQQCFDPHISEKFSGRALPITNSTLQQRFGDIHVRKFFWQRSADYQFNTSTAFWSHTCPKKSLAELCRFAIQHLNRFLTYTYPIAEALPECRLPIQHFNSVLEPYMSKKIFGRGYQLPFNTSTLNFPHTGSIFFRRKLEICLGFSYLLCIQQIN